MQRPHRKRNRVLQSVKLMSTDVSSPCDRAKNWSESRAVFRCLTRATAQPASQTPVFLVRLDHLDQLPQTIAVFRRAARMGKESRASSDWRFASGSGESPLLQSDTDLRHPSVCSSCQNVMFDVVFRTPECDQSESGPKTDGQRFSRGKRQR